MCVDLALGLFSFCFSSYKRRYIVAQNTPFHPLLLDISVSFSRVYLRACVRNEGEGFMETEREVRATASIPFRRHHQHQPPATATTSSSSNNGGGVSPPSDAHTRSSAQRTFMTRSSESVGSRLPSQCVQERVLLLLSTLCSVCVS